MKKNILVVDNHPVILKFMANLLEKKGHRVLTAEDGLSALDILKSWIPDIIFIDLIMPNISGEKLCRIVRSMPEMKDAFLIILSAIAAEKGVDFAELGANACIAKGPFNKMSEHVLTILDQLNKGASKGLSDKIIGVEDTYKEREITKELLSAKKHSDVILANLSEGIMELTSEGTIIYANPIAVLLASVSEEALLASSFARLFNETDCREIKDLIKAASDAPQTIAGESPVNLNGHQVSLNILPVEDDGHKSIIVILDDVSERKRIQSQLRQAQTMESTAILAGGIAHEFNNALMGIVGSIELLKMDLSKDEGRDRYFERMMGAAHRMSHHTDQLLAYAEGGKYQPKEISLGNFVTDTLPILEHSLSPAIRVETELPRDISYTKADLTQMQMVLSSILNNANEAIEDEGRIRITIRNEDLDEEFAKHHPDLEAGPYVCLRVEDDGRGMDEETRDRIFDPFFTTKFQGRGMGMAAVYGIVRNHDGWITVESELDKGTVVRIWLPAISAESREQGAKVVKEPKIELPKGEGTILVIEDEEDVMEITRAFLEMLGYRVLEAKTGNKGVEVARTFDGDIDLALLDIKLPDIPGDKVYPLIMEARPNLKVIVFSGYSIHGPAQEILDAGAEAFIQKPFSITTLSEKLKEVLKENKKGSNL